MVHEPRETGWALSYIDNPIDLDEIPIVYGGIWARFGALILDRIIAAILSIPLAAALGYVLYRLEPGYSTGEERAYAALSGVLLGYGLVSFAYEWIGTAVGGPFGKRLLNLKVVRSRDLEVPERGTALKRVGVIWVLGSIPFIGTVLSLGDCAWAIPNEERQTWHDRIAGTLVIKRNP